MRYRFTPRIGLKFYKDKWNTGQLVIPKFQRSYVWDQIRASKLVESFLLGLPVPGVFLYTDELLLIDGQQRILSVIKYFEGTFNNREFKLKNVAGRWAGRTFEELLKRDQLRLEESVLRATIIQQLDPDDNTSIYHIVERLNTGGVGLSAMEVRKCVYPGTFFRFLETLNKNSDWRAILGDKELDDRLRDVELVLRFLAMRERWTSYKKPMKTFLNDFMVSKQNISAKAKQTTRLMFEQTCANVVQQLGEKPFHLRPSAVNPGILDAVMVMMSLAGERGITDAATRYKALRSDKKFLDTVQKRHADETQPVWQRFEYARQMILD